ncbi:MAG: hypothetical protein WDO70_07735 [Alphaproteobacteria bacterium]
MSKVIFRVSDRGKKFLGLRQLDIVYEGNSYIEVMQKALGKALCKKLADRDGPSPKEPEKPVLLNYGRIIGNYRIGTVKFEP